MPRVCVHTVTRAIMKRRYFCSDSDDESQGDESEGRVVMMVTNTATGTTSSTQTEGTEQRQQRRSDHGKHYKRVHDSESDDDFISLKQKKFDSGNDAKMNDEACITDESRPMLIQLSTSNFREIKIRE